MKRLHIRLVTSSLALLVTVSLASAESKMLRFVADRDHPPITFAQGGVAKGLWVDLAGAVAERLGVRYAIQLDDWEKAQQDVQSGNADVLYSISFTEQRASFYELSYPVSRSLFTFFTLGRTGVETLNDLKGLKVGVAKAGLPGQLIEPLSNGGVSTFDSYELAFSALVEGRIDVFAGDRWVGDYILSQGKWSRVTPALGNFASLDAGFAVRKGNIALRDKLNDAILQLKMNGTIDAITNNWAPKGVVYFTVQEVLLSVLAVLATILVISGSWIVLQIRGNRERREAQDLSRNLMFALEQANFGVVISNESGTRPIYANREYARMHGYEVSEIIGQPWANLLVNEDFEKAKDGIRQTLAKGSHSGDLLRVRKDGTKFHSWFTATAIHTSTGRTTGIVVNLLDTTDREKREEEAIQSQKLESIGTLASGIAHDFNNILSALRGQFDLASLFLQRQQYEKARERLDKAPPLFDRAKALTSRLVGFAKGGNSVRSVAALGKHLNEWIELALVGSDVAATVEIASDLGSCECDEGQIGQVIHNLVINARQASPLEGRITVSAKNREIDGNPFVAVSVEDNGIGIPGDILPHIFEPFFSRRPGGSGLGLYISNSIVRQHSGRIDVTSAVGKGSCFTVLLPSSSQNPNVREEASCAELKLTGMAVVMDDEEAIRESVGEMLQLLGLEVRLARDGQDLFQQRNELAATGRRVELYVLDLTVPGRMGGIETAEKLRMDGDTALVIFMSGYSEDVLKLTARQSNGTGWLPKPFTNSELCNVLSRIEGTGTGGE